MELNETKSAIVTGGASGLGAAVARRLAAAFVQVSIFDTNADQGRVFAEQIGGRFHAVDVSDAASVAQGMAEVKSAQGGLDVLVNCAGIGPAAKTVSRGMPHDPALFTKVVGINLTGSFICASQAAALMQERPADTPDGERGGHRSHRLGCRLRRADGAGGLCCLKGWYCRHDAAHGA